MDLVTGAMGSLLDKLGELLKEEYNQQMSVRGDIKSLEKEMKSMYAALGKVADLPRDQLDEQVKLWAGEVRELSFEMEDVVDKFLVRVDDGSQPAANSGMLEWVAEKVLGLCTQWKPRHEIAEAIKAINQQVQEVANRRGRYTVDKIVASPPAVTPIDPRLGALYKEVTDLVGITGKRDQEIMKLLSEGDDMSKKNLKIVSVVGFGGLGKTTLVKTVYDKIKGEFDCRAFVSVGRHASEKKVFRDILIALGKYESHFTILDETQLIDKLREHLENKRYLIVIDDIWDAKLWENINWAFPKGNNFGSRLITTTRIGSVSKSCCSSANDSIYTMEPLSDDDSKRLFYKRIFSRESGCPLEFEEVSGDILKKCGGVPLAIITIASVLASDQKVNSLHEWKVLLESIGRGLTKDSHVDEMLTILSYSYHDLPYSYLKTCFLYLSMFPEDHTIMKDQLIWMWIAERFIQCKDAQTSLYETGESHFNELVNRSLIQPVYDDDDCFVNACRVHDIVLDLICSLSAEENFVTKVNGSCDTMSSQGIVRRLSLQNAREDQTRFLRHASIGQVRSVVSFASHANYLMPLLSTFAILRVLDLDGYDGIFNLRELGSLLHLRYLRLSRKGNDELPEEIGKLQFLQVLDLPEGTRLPSSVIKLTRLMRLCIKSGSLKLPEGIGNLTSMEVLGLISVDSISIVKELGNMEKLRELDIHFNKKSLRLVKAFVESLGRMRKIQHVVICSRDGHEVSMDLLGERWVPPAVLREFIMDGGVKFSTLPAWDSSHLSQLSKLILRVGEVRQEDLGFLGRLPALRVLYLDSHKRRPLRVGAEGFRRLETLSLLSTSRDSKLPRQILFQPGALPKAKRVELDISLRVAKEEAAGNGDDWFDVGMENLPSLRHVTVALEPRGVTPREAKQEKAALEDALRAHPSRPTFNISIYQCNALFEYAEQVKKLGNTLFEMLSEALGLKPSYLTDIECNQVQVTLCHYYPPCPQPELAIGTSRHSDSGFLITILLQDEIGGLQVLHDDRWVDVTPTPGACIVNIGDILQLISNDVFRSVGHRVVAKNAAPRVSIACFFSTHFHPASTRLYGPIKELLSMRTHHCTGRPL